MRPQPGTQKNPAAGLKPAVRSRMPWRVKAVEALSDYKLRVQFLDDLQGIVELKTLIHSRRAGVFAALTDKTLFNQVSLEHGVVTWPGELDLAPDAMYRAIKTKGVWKPASRVP